MKNEVKKCKVCRAEATCSFTSLVTTVGDKPRVQQSTKATHLCSRCIRVWAMTTRPEVGQPVVEAIEVLTRRSVRMAAEIKPEELVIFGIDYAFGQDKPFNRPQLVPKKKAVANPDAVRVRLSKSCVRRACDVIEKLDVPLKPQEDRDALAALLGRLQESIE